MGANPLGKEIAQFHCELAQEALARKHAPVISASTDMPAATPAREITIPHPPRDGL